MTQIGRTQFREHREGFDIEIDMSTDVQTIPGGDHSDDEYRAWLHNNWQFVSVRVTAGRAAHVIGEASRDGFEYGWFPHPEGSPVTEIFRNPVDQANRYYDPEAIEALTVEAVSAARQKLIAAS